MSGVEKLSKNSQKLWGKKYLPVNCDLVIFSYRPVH